MKINKLNYCNRTINLCLCNTLNINIKETNQLQFKNQTLMYDNEECQIFL